MARPQVLLRDLTLVKNAGIDTIISLLEPAEAAKFGLSGESDACAQLDMSFLSHPIRDMHLPDPETFTAFVAHVAERVNNGGRIALHCYASIGRSGMLACTVLGHFGFNAEAALLHVNEKRGVPVPDTTEQAAFIHTAIAARAIA
jgi:protein-tyrosine phosphatase